MGCKQSGLKIVFFEVLRHWLHGWLWVALLFKLLVLFTWTSRAMIVTNSVWGRGHTSTETTPAEFVIGSKTLPSEFVFYKRRCLEPSLNNLPLTEQEFGVAVRGVPLWFCPIFWTFLTNTACVRMHLSMNWMSSNLGVITAPYSVDGRMFPSAVNVFCTGGHGKWGRIWNLIL